jgi:glycosyltransferase involved in cell wall biosynthesis
MAGSAERNVGKILIRRMAELIAPPELVDVQIVCIATVPFFMATQLGTQIAALLQAGMRVTVVTSPGPELDRLPIHPNLHIHTLLIPRNVSPRADILAILNLFRLFKQLSPQIVHSTTPKAGLIAAIAGFLARTPIRLHTFTGQPWLNLQGAMRVAARQSDRLIGWLNTRCYADSRSQSQFLIEEGLLRANKISVVGEGSLSGVDIDRFDRERIGLQVRERVRKGLGISSDTPVLLFIGRIARDKGIRELLTAAEQLHSQGVDFSLLLLGPMDDEAGGHSSISRSELEGLSYLHYLGYSAVPEDFIVAADVLCLPSYREGFGTVVIEAAAMGVPTVGTLITGLTDAIVDGETGILVEVHDSIALANALRTLIENPGLRTHLGEQARARAREHFSSSRINAALLVEYGRLLDISHK